jgi:Galactose oxidase, central domain/Kelch motif
LQSSHHKKNGEEIMQHDVLLNGFSRRIAVVTVFIGLLCPVHESRGQVQHFQFPGPTWKAISPLQSGRLSYTLTPLQNNKILIAGGVTSGGILNSAELYDPHTHSFTPSSHLINLARTGHTATLLPDGTVLLTGGQTPKFSSAAGVCNQPGPLPPQLGVTGVATSCAELYDPDTDTFTAVGSMNTARANHTATLIDQILIITSTGDLSPPTPLRVLIAGGDDGNTSFNSLEYYDFYLRTFKTLPATLNTARTNHTATWLPSRDSILIAGGRSMSPSSIGSLASAEVFNPAFDGIQSVAITMTSARDGHTATGLKNGTVLVAGGFSSQLLDSAEIFDPATFSFTATPGRMGAARENHSAILMPNGSVLLAGGDDVNNGPLSSADVFDATRMLFSPTTHMINPRSNFMLGMTQDSNEVLAAGGAVFAGGGSFLLARNDAEVFVPFQPAHILNVDFCILHPVACQIVRQDPPFLLRAAIRDAMVLTPLPRGSEEAIKDKKAPVICKITISGLNEAWDVAPFSVEGVPLKVERSESRGSLVLTLAFLNADKFRAMRDSSHLAFQLTSKGEVGREYPVEVKMDVTSRPDLVRR